MRPLAVLISIVFGSAAAISFGLVTSLVVFLVLQGRHPQFAAELHPLAISSLLFVLLTAVAGIALYGTLRRMRWQIAAQGAMWITVLVVGFISWPR